MKRSELFLMILQLPVDFLMLIAASITAYTIRVHPRFATVKQVEFDISVFEYVAIAIWVALVWQVIFALFGLYSTDQNRKLSKDLVKVIAACSVGLGAIAVYMMLSLQFFDSRFLIIASWIIAIFYVIIGRIIIRGYKGLLYRSGAGLRKVVIIGNDDVAKIIVQTLKERKALGYEIVQIVDSFTTGTANKWLDQKIDEVIVTNPHTDAKQMFKIINFCADRHIVLKYSADLFATYSANMRVSPLAGIPIVELRKTRISGWGRVIKRIFDIAVSIIVIIITSPLTLLSIIAILIETGRPIIYKNERIGYKGHNFFAYKFRSMYQRDSTGSQFGSAGKKAEEKEKELIKKQSARKGRVYKIANDPRVTPFGSFIRRFSIDELPQFFNVLKGEMSVIGPRPHQPREVAGHKLHHREVLSIKPGITGMAQITGRSDISFEEEVKLDILYVEQWSILLDLIILIKTPFILFKKRKAL